MRLMRLEMANAVDGTFMHTLGTVWRRTVVVAALPLPPTAASCHQRSVGGFLES